MFRRDAAQLGPPRWRLPLIRRAPLLRGSAIACLLCLAAALVTVEPRRAEPVASPAGPMLPAGTVGYPLRLPDPAVASVLRAGQHLDVLAASGDSARVLVSDVLVLRASGGPPDGALVYLAVTHAQATLLAATAPETRLSVTVRSP